MDLTKKIFVKNKSILRKEYKLLRHTLFKKLQNNNDLCNILKQKFINNLILIPPFKDLNFNNDCLLFDKNSNNIYVNIHKINLNF